MGGLTRLAAAMSFGNSKKAMWDMMSSKNFCYYQNNRVVGAFFTSGSGRDSGRDQAAAEEEGSGATGFVADKAKEGAKTAAETAETAVKMGDTAKKIADDAWGRTKETAQRIKDSVVGEGGPRDEAEPKSRMPTDSSTEDVRKRSGGYD